MSKATSIGCLVFFLIFCAVAYFGPHLHSLLNKTDKFVTPEESQVLVDADTGGVPSEDSSIVFDNAASMYLDAIAGATVDGTEFSELWLECPKEGKNYSIKNLDDLTGDEAKAVLIVTIRYAINRNAYSEFCTKPPAGFDRFAKKAA